jgi:hypothetical protein
VSGEGNTVSGGSGGGEHVDLHSNPQVPSPVDPRACWTNVRKKKTQRLCLSVVSSMRACEDKLCVAGIDLVIQVILQD